jgi:hypothetical protein
MTTGSGLLADYDWAGRSIERHRAQIRAALGFQELTRADEDELAWCRTAEVTDALVELLIGLVAKINTKAERMVEADGTDARGAPPLCEEVVRPQRTIKGKESTHSSPLSTYSAPGGLPQDPGRAA